tara:strand:+ start:145 stop:384 length:240 start_codon:yes stop_codon:yes gene_type:complete
VANKPNLERPNEMCQLNVSESSKTKRFQGDASGSIPDHEIDNLDASDIAQKERMKDLMFQANKETDQVLRLQKRAIASQ